MTTGYSTEDVRMMFDKKMAQRESNKASTHCENKPSSLAQTHFEPVQPAKFSTPVEYIIQPEKWRPQFDTEGPFCNQIGKAGPCVPVMYNENGINKTYRDAYWTPVYPTWVAAASAEAADKLKKDGFKVLDVELSHEARCHFGGPQSQCDSLAKEYSPCVNMKNNPVMREKYGQQLLNNNWNSYINKRNKETIEIAQLDRQIAMENQYYYAQLTGMMSVSTPQSSSNKSRKAKVEQEINNQRSFSFAIERAPSNSTGGHLAMANVLAGRGCNYKPSLGSLFNSM